MSQISDAPSELARRSLEQRLAREAAAGDESAFSALFQQHHQQVYGIARAVTGDPELARDALQETFLKVFRSLRGWRGESTLRTWIHRIAVRCAIDQRRKALRQPAAGPAVPEPHHDPRPELENALALRRVHALAERLGGRQGLILRLRLLGGLTNNEVASVLGLDAANVRMQLSKAVRRLRSML